MSTTSCCSPSPTRTGALPGLCCLVLALHAATLTMMQGSEHEKRQVDVELGKRKPSEGHACMRAQGVPHSCEGCAQGPRRSLAQGGHQAGAADSEPARGKLVVRRARPPATGRPGVLQLPAQAGLRLRLGLGARLHARRHLRLRAAAGLQRRLPHRCAEGPLSGALSSPIPLCNLYLLGKPSWIA